MSEPRNTIGSMHFGPFELSTESSELRKHGQRLKLSGQAIDVLLMLASNAGKLVTREELQRKLWPGDSFGDFEHGLNAAVNRLRETLGDSATDPTYIETVPRRGYRFIARVDQVPNTKDPTAPDNAVELRYQHPADIRADLKRLKRDTEANITRTPSEINSTAPLGSVDFTGGHPSIGAVLFVEIRRHKGVLAMMLVGLAVLIAGLGMYFSRLHGRGIEWNQQGMKISRVTQSGNAVNVAISPDGRYVVYALEKEEKQSLNIRQLVTGSDVQILAPDEVLIWGLTFSPDANFIDFVRSEKNHPFDTYLYRMPVFGGTPHLVMQGGIDGASSYSPDGTQFAFLRANSGLGKADVLIAKADGSNERVIATRPYLDEYAGVAWSPDGKTVAFTTSEATKRLRSVLSAVSLADGSVREIYSAPGAIGRPRWLPDGSGLLVPMKNADQTFRGQLWSITFPSGKVQRLTNDLMDYQLCCLELTQDGKALVDTEHTKVSDLWIAPAGDTAKAKQITSREFTVGRFSWMSSGRIILANGDSNLLALSPDGSGVTPLTPNEHATWDPSVCGDGRHIVYSSYQEQKVGIWRMDADGSNSVRIADESFATDPQCSPDGKWVIYLRGPSWTPVRVSITGTKNPEVVTQDCVIGFGHFLAISPDGKLIAYPTSPVENQASPSASRPNQLKVIPFEGGAPLHQFDWPASASTPRWAHGGEAVQYISTQNGVSNIWQQKLIGGTPKQITNFKSGLIFDFEWSPDGRQLALTRGSESSDVVLIRNFR